MSEDSIEYTGHASPELDEWFLDLLGKAIMHEEEFQMGLRQCPAENPEDELLGAIFGRKLCLNGCCQECESCAHKPGTPLLCDDCLRQRWDCVRYHRLINALQEAIECAMEQDAEVAALEEMGIRF